MLSCRPAVFKSPTKANFVSYTIEKLKVNPAGTEGDVTIKSDMVVNTFDIKGAVEQQKWIIENGKWVFAAKPVIGFAD